MTCDLLDLRCIFVNELIGNVVLTVIISAIVYFIIAGKLRLGFDTTIAFTIPLLLIIGLMFTGFSAIFAFATILIGLLIAFLFNHIIGNR